MWNKLFLRYQGLQPLFRHPPPLEQRQNLPFMIEQVGNQYPATQQLVASPRADTLPAARSRPPPGFHCAVTVSSGTRSFCSTALPVHPTMCLDPHSLEGVHREAWRAPVIPTVSLSRTPLLRKRQEFGTPMSTFLTHWLPCLESAMANPRH